MIETGGCGLPSSWCTPTAGRQPVGQASEAQAHRSGLPTAASRSPHLMMDPIQTTVRNVISTPVTTTGSTRLSYGPSSF